jgi:hypothetical protein
LQKPQFSEKVTHENQDIANTRANYNWSIYPDNVDGEQRPKFISSLHGIYVKPLSSRRLHQWHGYVLFLDFGFPIICPGPNSDSRRFFALADITTFFKYFIWFEAHIQPFFKSTNGLNF